MAGGTGRGAAKAMENFRDGEGDPPNQIMLMLIITQGRPPVNEHRRPNPPNPQ